MTPLSVTQKYILVDQKLYPLSGKYNVGFYFKLVGNIDSKKLCDAIVQVLLSQKIFSSRLDGVKINPENEIRYENTFNKSLDDVLEWMDRDNQIPFDIEQGPLYKIHVISLSQDLHIWYMKCHHILMDGWSFMLLFNQTTEAYQNLLENKPLKLPEADYLSFIKEQENYLNGNQWEKDKMFWEEYFKDYPVIKLYSPIDQIIEKKDCSFNFILPKELVYELRQLAHQYAISLPQLFIGLLHINFRAFYKYDFLTFGMPILNRKKKYNSTVGPFINVIPIRLNSLESKTFLDFFKSIKLEFFKVLRHQRFQYADILNALPKNAEDNRLYDIRFSYEPFALKNSFAGHSYEAHPLSNYQEDEPHSIHVMQFHDQEIHIRWDFNPNYVEHGEALSLFESYGYLTGQLPKLINQPLKEAFSNYFKMHRKVLSFSNVSGRLKEYPKCFISAWNKNLKKYLNQTCVHFNDNIFTYLEINDLADEYVQILCKKGICSGDKVIILLERSEKYLSAILAMIKLQVTYVPLDTSCPTERLFNIYVDCGCKGTFTQEEYSNKISKQKRSMLFINVESGIQRRKRKKNKATTTLQKKCEPNANAYIIYTSGSTGKPKGVPIRMESLMDYACSFKKYFKLKSTDIVLQQASFAFDTSVEEIFPVLLAGGSLFITKNNKDFPQILEDLYREQITILSTHPHFIRYLNDNANLKKLSLRLLISGGDVLKPDDIVSVWKQIPTFNTYGPTESTVCASYYPVQHLSRSIPIGKPIRNRRIYILGPSLELLPTYARGEIFIGGKGLSPGYINNHTETHKRFIPDPYREKDLIYCTGDLGKWDSRGNITYLGRNDDQVKIHGNRIELGEIEKVVSEQEGINQVCVLAKNKTLIAFCVTQDGSIDRVKIYQRIKMLLPRYMLPTYFVVLDKIPLTLNGKIDVKSLPSPTPKDLMRQTYRAPKSSTEKSLEGLWQDFTGVNKIGVDDNFLEIGGHSLQLLKLLSTIRKKFSLNISLSDLYKNLTIAELANLIDSISLSTDSKESPILPAPYQKFYEISSTQRRLWLLSQKELASQAYHISGSFKLFGLFDLKAFKQALLLLVNRHETLRTVFKEKKGEVFQVILSTEFAAKQIPLTVKTRVPSDNDLKNFYTKPFDLAKGPLWRIAIHIITKNKYILSASFHHLISDGWSVENFLADLSEAYTSSRNKILPNWKTLPSQYKDYVYWQKDYFRSSKYEKDKAFWLNRCTPLTTKIDLPTNFSPPREKSFLGMTLQHSISAGLLESMHLMAKDYQVTLYMIIIASIRTLIYRYSGQNEFIIGGATAGREHDDLSDQIGLFINTLLFKGNINSTDNFVDLIKRERQTLVDSYSHQHFPYDHLVNELNSTNLLQVMVILHNQQKLSSKQTGLNLSGLNIERYKDIERGVSQFSLTFAFFETADSGLTLKLEYDTDLFQDNTIRQMVKHYEQLLHVLLEQPNTPIGQIDYLGNDERSLILNHFSGRDKPYVNYGSLNALDLIEKTCLTYPNAPALLSGDSNVSFKDIHLFSNKLANYLLKNQSIRPHAHIGVKLPRDKWLPIALLGVLKAGMTYVPLDEEYPAERLSYIEKDSKCEMILDSLMLRCFLDQLNTVSEATPQIKVSSDDLAYVIYTSGSTGNPKGVCITHGNLRAFLSWCLQEFQKDSFDIVYGITSHCFDLSIFEIFFTWAAGKCLRFLPNGLAVPDYLPKDQNVLLNTVPSLVQYLLSSGIDFSPISVLNMAGEEIPLSLKQQLDCKRIAIRNLYGPSEDTTYSTFKKLGVEDAYISIGRPIQNSTAYIFDAQRKLVPAGVTGEIYLGGDGLSSGYLGKKALTKEKFVENPYIEGERLYRTGDLGKWLPNGELIFKGRIDHQVKVRGYRVELGEIEHVISSQKDLVSACVTLLIEQNLIAYVVGKENFNSERLKERIRHTLPSYLIPDIIIPLSELPLTPNGKIDRQHLENLPLKLQDHIKYTLPQDDLEKQIWHLWKDVLGHDQFGVDDSFFEVGGNSLKALKLVYQIKNNLQRDCLYLNIIEYSSISRLSKFLTNKVKLKTQKGIKARPSTISSIERRIWFDSQNPSSSLSYNIVCAFKITSIINRNKFQEVINEMVKNHPILRTTYVNDKHQILPKINSFNEITGYYLYDNAFEKVDDLIASEANRLFDLEKGPLFKVILNQSANDFFVILSFHHIICDANSILLFIEELFLRYQGNFSENILENIQNVSLSDIENQNLEDNSQYWKEILSSLPPPIELPYDNTPSNSSFEGSRIIINLPSLKNISHIHRFTPFAIYTSSLITTLYKITGNEDIIIGIPVTLRDYPSLEKQMGCLINTLPLRIQFNKEDNLHDLIENVNRSISKALSHKEIPFDNLLSKNNTKKIFNVMIDMLHQEHFMVPKNCSSLGIIPYDVPSYYSKNDMTFYIYESSDVVRLAIEYKNKLFHKQTIEYFAEIFLETIQAIKEDTSVSIENIVSQDILEFDPL